MLGINYSFFDMNLSDGASLDLPLPFGIYQVSVTLYNLQDEPIDHQILIYKILVFLLKTQQG
jgi:hypothetical protein